MRRLPAVAVALGFLALWSACSTEPSGGTPDGAAIDSPDAGSVPDAGPGLDAGGPYASVNKAANCASTFGNVLTNDFGRLDGTIVAVVGPADTQCAIPNSDHLVVQVLTNGAVYRIVINILSDGRNGTDTKLRYAELHHALVGGGWSEGWHPGATLDYPTTLDAHTTAGFTPHEMNELVSIVSSRMVIGAKFSAFATSSGGVNASGAHLIHRNDSARASDDGALVIDPDSSDPVFLLFHFDGQTF